MNELFNNWADYPPTNILVKALVEGFGGGKKTIENDASSFQVTPEADLAMRSAVAQISAKAGRGLPVIRGRDTGLPNAPPIFDIEELKARNSAVAKRRNYVG